MANRFKVGDRVVVKSKKVYLASFDDESLNKCLKRLAGEKGTVVDTAYRVMVTDLFSRVHVLLDKDKLRDTSWIFETNAIKRLKDNEKT